ncbi:hypothetical protein PG996_001821 [Apiospora saccharicola]|uniref:Carboxylesterase type B domain-containing protein n=1 Tax=Apiospora saccharicola TaxID=335842 RepID=A0ABR1WHR2_9PEZI
MSAYSLIVALSLAQLAFAQSLVAQLDYGTFQGAYDVKYNISYWQKIPYAAPPVGENRFRTPQPPLPIDDQVYNSSQPFDMCHQRTVNGSEDCLYLGLYSRPWAEGQALRPVVVTFYGAGSVQGSASFTIPPPAYPILNVSSSSTTTTENNGGNDDDDMLFVYPNYRVNAFGPWRFDRLANLTGCGGAQVSDSLRCLKQMDVQAIREASLQISQSHKYTTTYFSWVPVIDGDFLPEPLSKASTAPAKPWLVDMDTDMQAAFSMYNTHEGESFIPPGLGGAESAGDPPFNTSVASFRQWAAGYLPGFSSADRRKLEELYPESGTTNTSPYNDTYTRAGLVYRDSVLACPAYWMTGTAPKGSWLGEYTIAPAKHASDVYWWNTVNSSQQTDRLHYEGYAEFVVDERGFSTAGLAKFE